MLGILIALLVLAGSALWQAGRAVRLTFDEACGDAFYATEFMSDDSPAILIEGDMPAEFADLEVFVAPPPTDGGPLIRSRKKAGSKPLAAAAPKRTSRNPVVQALLLQQEAERSLLETLLSAPRAVKVLHRDVLSFLKAAISGGERGDAEGDDIAPGFEPLETAGLCVVTYRDAAGREAAERYTEEIRALRTNTEALRRIFGPLARQRPATIVAANLRDPRDPGTKRAVARVRRAVRAACGPT